MAFKAQQLHLYRWRLLLLFRLLLSTDANEKVDNFDEKHDGESKPETQHAADVWHQDLSRHCRLVFNDQRKVVLQHYVELQKVLTDQRRQRRVLRHNKTITCIAAFKVLSFAERAWRRTHGVTMTLVLAEKPCNVPCYYLSRWRNVFVGFCMCMCVCMTVQNS